MNANILNSNLSITIDKDKTHILPEWYLIIEKIRKINYTKLEKIVLTQFGKEKISRKQLFYAIKLLKKEEKKEREIKKKYDYFLDDKYIFLDSNIRKGDEKSLDLKIAYIESLNEREKNRRLNLDKKAEAMISRSSILITIITALGAFGSKNHFVIINNKIIILLFILIIFILIGFALSIILAYLVFKPTKYNAMMPNIILDHINKDLRNQKSDYLSVLYRSVNKTIRINEKRGKLLNTAFIIFISSIILLVLFVIIYAYIIFLKNIIVIC